MKTINNYYNKKVTLCKKLSNLNVKKVSDTHILTAAMKVEIPFKSAKRAWRIFQETGGKNVDKRGKGTSSIAFKKKKFAKYTKYRTLKVSAAAAIIIEYMTTNIGAIDLCNKHMITPDQFYTWIHEIQVSGTLLGERVLDPKKYAKVEVLDVIRISKRPNTTKKSIIALTELERAAYERVGTVLKKYLSAIAEG